MAPAGITIAFALAASAMTYLGGRIALRPGINGALVLGVTAGVVIGIVLFDLLPNAFAIAPAADNRLLGALAVGMMLSMAMHRALEPGGLGGTALRPHLGPASLTLHSLIDGLGMGLAFNLSIGAGIAVAVAVVAHDIADGINTVGLSLAGNRRDLAHRWLLANAAAPVLGVLMGTRLHLAGASLALILSGFAGALLYIGACEVLPRSRTAGQPLPAAFATIFGLVSIYCVLRLEQI